MRTLIFVLLTILAVGVFDAGRAEARANAPSFSCDGDRSSVERIICSDADIASADRLMEQLYALAQVSAFGKGPSNERAAQREWMKTRLVCLNDDQSKAKCLAGTYRWRNEQLALAILFSHPDIALPQLHRLDPEAAGMFEAIYLYGIAPPGSTAILPRIAALLQPYAASSRESAWGEPSPQEAVKSDDAFAEFVGIRSAYIPGEAYGRAFPCAAVLRKPKLIDATGPRFGSNMDNFVIKSDCDETLPPLPRLGKLVEKRSNGMTDCGGGSIRFAYYRAFSNDVLAAKVATSSQLSNKRIKPFPRRRNVSRADISAALDELAAYYVRYGRASARQARPLAQQIIYRMLDEAWQC